VGSWRQSNRSRTKRLIIREFRASDREVLLAIVRDPGQIEHMLLSLESEQQLDEFLSMVLSSIDTEPRLQWHFAVEDLTSGQYLMTNNEELVSLYGRAFNSNATSRPGPRNRRIPH